MYEAAIRHIAKKPIIQIYPNGQKIPFDITNLRSIMYDPDDLLYPEKLKELIKKAIEEIEKPDYKMPEILKYKFDLERICSDPAKFVELLKKHLTNFSFLDGVSSKLEPAIIEKVWTTSTNRIKCPKCGVTTSSDYNFTLNISNTYRCNNCKTEFEG